MLIYGQVINRYRMKSLLLKIIKFGRYIILKLRNIIEFIGDHPFSTGLMAVSGILISIIGFNVDRNENESTSYVIESMSKKIDAIDSKISTDGKDWQVMKKTFFDIQVGGPIERAYDLDFERTLRTGYGDIKHIEWRLKNNDLLKVSYNSPQNRVLKINIEWGGDNNGREIGIADFKFGKTTLKDIRTTFGSNGFAYATNMMYADDDGLTTFNAFELKYTPSIIIVFKTHLNYSDNPDINPEAAQNNTLGELGPHFRLVGVTIADEQYLDEIWGKGKLYDPNSNLIVLR